MFWWKLLDEFMNAPWRVEESPLTHLPVRQGEWNGVLPNGWKVAWMKCFRFLYTWKVCVSTLHPIHRSPSLSSVFLSCHPERSEGSRGHKAMNDTVDAHEILRRKAPPDEKIENCHIESHTHLQRNPRRLKISMFLLQMHWNPSATSVTVLLHFTISRCRWSATIARWFIVWYAFVAVLQWLLQMFWCKWRNRPFHRRVNRVKGSGAKLYVYAYIRVRVIILRCSINLP